MGIFLKYLKIGIFVGKMGFGKVGMNDLPISHHNDPKDYNLK